MKKIVMKILFINPPRYNGLPVIREDRCEMVNRYLYNPPYSLIQIAACLREKGEDVKIIDANIENISYSDIQIRLEQFKPEIIIFRFTPETIEMDMQTATIGKTFSPDTITIGLCWTLRKFAKDVIKDYPCLDIYVAGEYGTYDTTFRKLIDAIHRKTDLQIVPGITIKLNGEFISTEPAKSDTVFDPPLPAYDLLPALKNYYINPKHKEHSPFTIIYTSKGCPYNCTYCVVRKTKWQARTVENVMHEISWLKNQYDLKCIFFKDETFTMDRERTIALCNEMIKNRMNLRWYAATRVDKIDMELLKLMRKAGCRSLSFGIESGSQIILDNIQKGVTVEQAMKAIEMTKKAGIWVHLAFMIGLPGENRITFQETKNFIKEALPSMAQFNATVSFPGTPLYDMALKKGWINNKIDYTQLKHDQSVMRTEELTSEEIIQMRKKAYRLLYFSPRWYISHFKNFEEIGFTLRYYMKCLGMFFLHRMKHSH